MPRIDTFFAAFTVFHWRMRETQRKLVNVVYGLFNFG